MYPAIALASALSIRPEAPELLLVGTRGGIEARLVPEAGYRFAAVRARGVERSLRGVLAAPALILGAVQALRLLARERPDAVVGMGGFASAPVLAAARLRRAPYVLHEQNAIPGLVNRLFASRASAVCLTFEEAAERLPAVRTVVTGNPIRGALSSLPAREQACKLLGLNPATPTVLIFGGSRGARRINQAAVEARRRGFWPEDLELEVLLVAGRAEFEETREMLADAPAGPDYRVVPYLDDMAPAYACADLVLARAGATTIAEIAAAGVPSVLVPYPYATEDHQRRNAGALARAGACEIVEDAELDGARLVQVLAGLLRRRRRLAEMAAAARRWARPDAAEALADETIRVASARGK